MRPSCHNICANIDVISVGINFLLYFVLLVKKTQPFVNMKHLLNLYSNRNSLILTTTKDDLYIQTLFKMVVLKPPLKPLERLEWIKNMFSDFILGSTHPASGRTIAKKPDSWKAKLSGIGRFPRSMIIWNFEVGSL